MKNFRVRVRRDMWDRIMAGVNNLPDPHDHVLINARKFVDSNLPDIEIIKDVVLVKIELVEVMQTLVSWSTDSEPQFADARAKALDDLNAICDYSFLKGLQVK